MTETQKPLPPLPGAGQRDQIDTLADALKVLARRVDDLRERQRQEKRADAPLSNSELRSMMAALERHLEMQSEDGGGEEPGEEGESETDTAAVEPPGSPAPLAAGDRRPLRADSLAAQDRLAELQQQWSRVVMAHGDRGVGLLPMIGETPTAFDRRLSRRYQRHSPRWAGVDLREAEGSVVRIAAPEIRKDAYEAAMLPEPGAVPWLREVRERDRAGREFTRWVGPVGAENGFLTPFRLPRMKVRIRTPQEIAAMNL